MSIRTSQPTAVVPAGPQWTRAAVVLFLLFAVLAVGCLARALDHDEQQFVASGTLLARGGLLPYLDYPYFHLPNLVFVFAGLFRTNGFLLLTARSFNIACAVLLLLLVFSLALSAFRFLEERRWSVATGVTLLLALNPVFRFTTGRAWNHDLAILAGVAAFATLVRGLQRDGSGKWIAASGALLGIAVGTRLTFLPLIIPFVVLTLMFRPAETVSYRGMAIFLGTLTLAMLPTITLFAADPKMFLFDNLTCNGTINLRFRQAETPDNITFGAKLLFLLGLIFKSPSNLLLLTAFGFFACWFPSRGGWREALRSPPSAAILLIVPFAFLGALLPTPSYCQYYGQVMPFLCLGAMSGYARFWKAHDAQRRLDRLLIAALLVAFLELIPDLYGSAVLTRPSQWAIWNVHKTGWEIRSRAGTGPVLTLAPIYPLEGGVGIYKDFCTGPFAWRLNEFADEKDQARYHLVHRGNLDVFLASKPTAILTGVEKTSLEGPLVDYARKNQYVKTGLSDRRVLWLASPKPDP